jgi:hypothetical protein
MPPRTAINPLQRIRFVVNISASPVKLGQSRDLYSTLIGSYCGKEWANGLCELE